MLFWIAHTDPKVILNIVGDNNGIASGGPTILGFELAIAVFAINFSLQPYQSTPYRALIGPLTNKHKAIILSVIFISILPIIGYLFVCRTSAFIALTAILNTLFIMIASVLLLTIGNYEVNPVNLIKNNCSNEHVEKYILNYLKNPMDSITPVTHNNIPHPTTNPLPYYISNKIVYIPSYNRSPYNYLENLAIVAIKNLDFETYEDVIKRYVECTRIIHEKYVNCQGDNKAYSDLNANANEIFNRIAIFSLELDASGIVVDKFLKINREYVIQKICKNPNPSSMTFSILNAMSVVSGQILRKANKNTALFRRHSYQATAQIFMRTVFEIIKICLDNPPRDWGDAQINRFVNFAMYSYKMPQLIMHIDILAREAIDADNKDFFEVSISSIRWLACQAIYKNNSDVTYYCLKRMVELGISSYEHDIMSNERDIVKDEILMVGDYGLARFFFDIAEWKESIKSMLSELYDEECNIELEYHDGERRMVLSFG